VEFYHAYARTHYDQYAYQILNVQFYQFQEYDQSPKFRNGSHTPDNAQLGHWYWCYSTVHRWFPISLPLLLYLYLVERDIIFEILALISQNFNRSPYTVHPYTMEFYYAHYRNYYNQYGISNVQFCLFHKYNQGPIFTNGSRDPDNTHLGDNTKLVLLWWESLALKVKSLALYPSPCSHHWELHMAISHTTFEASSFSHFRDISGGVKF